MVTYYEILKYENIFFSFIEIYKKKVIKLFTNWNFEYLFYIFNEFVELQKY